MNTNEEIKEEPCRVKLRRYGPVKPDSKKDCVADGHSHETTCKLKTTNYGKLKAKVSNHSYIVIFKIKLELAVLL